MQPVSPIFVKMWPAYETEFETPALSDRITLHFSWNETGKSRKFIKVVVNKFLYPDQRFHTKTLGKPMTEFIEKYKENIPDLLKKVKTTLLYL
jgi:hypothetical protein